MENAKQSQHQDHAGHHDAHQGETVFTYWLIYILLLVLLVATVVVARIDLGILNTAIALFIAVVKALLVILFFMHVRHGSKLTWIFVAASFFWLGIFIVFTFSDYGTAGMNGYPNGGREPGAQAGLVQDSDDLPRPDKELHNPLRPLVPTP